MLKIKTLISFKVSVQHQIIQYGYCTLQCFCEIFTLLNKYRIFFILKPISKFHIKIRVADPHHFNTDPDPSFNGSSVSL
jgi:hypothetical protein